MEPLVEALAPPADVLDEAQRAPTPAAALDLLGAAYREDTPQDRGAGGRSAPPGHDG